MDIFSLQSVFLLLFVFAISHLCLRLYAFKNKASCNTGFKNHPLFGTLPEFIRNRHRFLDWSTDALARCPTNTVLFSRPGKVQGIITANPSNVEHMLKNNFDNYPKGEHFISHLEDFLGRGIFNSDGDLWKIQRKTASYEFNTKSLRNFVMENVSYEIKSRLIPLLERACTSNEIVDVQDILERFAFDNVCKVAFNVDPSCLSGENSVAGEFMRAFEEAAILSSERFMSAVPSSWKIKKFLDMGSERRLRKSIRTVHQFAEKIIRSRMEEKTDNEDLLSRFIANEHDNSPEFLRDIVISFILAGRDTTSTALTWFFWLLSSRPDIERNILKELNSIRTRYGKRIGDTYGFDELREMNYLHAAISEAMRLYPPVPVDTKACLEDDVMPDGTVVRKGWFVTYNSYAMGRMESVWGSDCRGFSPERWIENGIYRPENPFRFPVFHAGPRMCLGKDMAYIQMKSIAASVVERFKMDVEDKDKCPEYLLSLTLRMKGGLRVTVKERLDGEVD